MTVQVNVSIPSRGSEAGFARVELSGDRVSLSQAGKQFHFDLKDFNEAIKLLGYKPGPVYCGQQAEREGRTDDRVGYRG